MSVNIKEDRNSFIKTIIEMIEVVSHNEPLNGDFADGLTKLPDAKLQSLYDEYKVKFDAIQSRQKAASDIARPRPN